jgi:hypothetical protein
LKVPLAVLLLAGLAFAVVVVWGATGPNDPPDPAVLRGWRSSLISPPRLRAGDLFGSCIQRQTLTIALSQTCQIAIRPADAPVRQARLSLNPGGQALLIVSQPNSITVKKQLSTATPALDLDVFGKGGRMAVTCLSSNPCTITLQD